MVADRWKIYFPKYTKCLLKYTKSFSKKCTINTEIPFLIMQKMYSEIDSLLSEMHKIFPEIHKMLCKIHKRFYEILKL